jgi:hypothetical protein
VENADDHQHSGAARSVARSSDHKLGSLTLPPKGLPLILITRLEPGEPDVPAIGLR